MGVSRLTAGVALSCVACGLSVIGTYEAPVGDDAGAPVDATAPIADADTDAPRADGSISVPIDGGGAPVTIASGGTVVAPTGSAQQTHLVYAENGRRWWLFTIASTAATSLQAWSSADFVTWSQAQDLPLPRSHAGEGSNFSVAYAAIGTHDVVHLAMGLAGTSNARTHYHARAEVAGSSIAWSALSGVSTVNDPLLGDPEGGVTIMTASGHVTDFTGWAPYQGSQTSTGNQDAYTSQAADDGGPWTSGFGGAVDIDKGTKTINARAAVSLGGENILSIWESADDPEPDPLSLRSSRTTGGGWSPSIAVFSNTKFGVNDWGATALAGNDVHAVRRTNGFEHRRYDGNTWRAGDAISMPASNGKKNTGLVLLHDATRVVLAAIAGDSSIQMTSWAGGAWSAWTTVAPASGTRIALSGWWSPTAGFGLVWTEANSVVGVRVAL